MDPCPRCGSPLREPGPCPICDEATDSFTRRARQICPQCRDPLKLQNWEGHVTYSCPTCRGTYFPGSNMEKVLDKIRRRSEAVDAEDMIEEVRRRAQERQPKPPRPRGCPVCDHLLQPVIYAGVTGIYIEVCKLHGVWVDEPTFLELSDFVSAVGGSMREKIEKLRKPLPTRRKDLLEETLDDQTLTDLDSLHSQSRKAGKRKGGQPRPQRS